MIRTYKQAENLLTSQSKFCINLGLDRISSLLKLFNNPQNKIKIIHIAGTNGKGSVSTILANILKCSGYKTGLYTSPHLIDYTERIKINNKKISKKDFAFYIEKICRTAENNKIFLTEFEILTASAFLYFSDEHVDIAILETGLGGRYDATNICKNTLLSIITSISLDHTDRLGNTIDKIAYEKGGIIKPNSSVIISNENKGFQIIEKIAKENNAPIYTVNKDTEIYFENNINYAIINSKKCKFPLLGIYQKQNLALVLKAVEFLNKNFYEISEISVNNGLKSVKWGARLEYIKQKNLLIDGAHNPDAALFLKKSLDFYFPNTKRIFIYSSLNTKDYKKISKILFNPEDEIYYYEFHHPNAISYEKYKTEIKKNIKLIKKEQLQEIINKEGLKIITGSLYMIGEIYKRVR